MKIPSLRGFLASRRRRRLNRSRACHTSHYGSSRFEHRTIRLADGRCASVNPDLHDRLGDRVMDHPCWFRGRELDETIIRPTPPELEDWQTFAERLVLLERRRARRGFLFALLFALPVAAASITVVYLAASLTSALFLSALWLFAFAVVSTAHVTTNRKP